MPADSQTTFHQSYFEHPCTVMTELDVLTTDIRGRSCLSRFRRWFHSWFLLSYTDARVRLYYLSFHAIQLERVQHFRQYRGRIHPLSRFNFVWTNFIFLVQIVNRVLLHQNTAMFYGKQTSTTLTTGIVLEAVMLFDLFIKLKTGYTKEISRKVILDACMGYVHYCSTKFFLHFSSAMPLQFIMFLRFGLHNCLLCRATYFVCILKLFGVFGLARLYDASRYLDRNQSSYTKMHVCKTLRIVILALFTMLQFIDLIDTINIFVILYSQNVPKESYFSMVLSAKLIMYKVPDIFFVCVELSILCKSVLLFGYGMYKHDYYMDKLFSLICHIISCSFCLWGFMECYAIVHRSEFMHDESVTYKRRTANWMEIHQISDQTSHKINDYYANHLSRPKVIEKHNELFKILPKVLNNEIKLSAYYNYLRRIPYFQEWPVEIVEELGTLLREDIYLERDIISHPFTPGDGLVIIYAGVLAVYNVAQNETGHLIDGDYFGELSLVTDKELRTSTVSAVTVCEVLTLSKGVFRKIMRKHTDLFFKLRNELLMKYKE